MLEVSSQSLLIAGRFFMTKKCCRFKKITITLTAIVSVLVINSYIKAFYPEENLDLI